ncbi:sigma factor [Hyalangium rubrum]|uniref:Sigma factor n=1 Tax=Hyalangium rubrum TaxID=3103134 RepID=A0ABU5H250_9BACT|nr:sigma factor [Hyalangium sp. s54d21]MDY7227371.1 sigma factor [Hyalangium sp. s54d21]
MAALFTDPRGFVAKVAARVLKGSADLEDVVQDVFVAVVACAGKLDRIDALGAWLHAVTVKQARTTIRRRRRRRSMEAGDEHLEAASRTLRRAAEPKCQLARQVYR